MKRSGPGELVALGCFIDAIRDAGYRGPGAALAELIDNAWEAEASEVHLSLHGDREELVVAVQDNGHGMSPAVLRLALQFGGTTRYGSRTGLGRYGMGLPAASLSQAQRLDIYSWTAPGRVWWTYLDARDVRDGRMTAVPRPRRRRPPWHLSMAARGTIVLWTCCDRLASAHGAGLDALLRAELGRLFREHLWSGKRLVLNGVDVAPVDPLCLRKGQNLTGAVPYGPVLEYPIATTDGCRPRRTSKVLVRFVELPVAAWHHMSNEEKRVRGISKRAGVSVLRAGREIDAGWFFMGGKRRENYDDWWRCEVRFEPELDELFGVSHTKQGIRPSQPLLRCLTPDMERIAHDLNLRVRKAFLDLRGSERSTASVQRAQTRDALVAPPRTRSRRNSLVGGKRIVGGLSYRIRCEDFDHDCFFEPRLQRNELVLILNRQHAFFNEATTTDLVRSRTVLELVLLAAARAEVRRRREEREVLERFRQRWSNILMAFLS